MASTPRKNESPQNRFLSSPERFSRRKLLAKTPPRVLSKSQEAADLKQMIQKSSKGVLTGFARRATTPPVKCRPGNESSPIAPENWEQSRTRHTEKAHVIRPSQTSSWLQSATTHSPVKSERLQQIIHLNREVSSSSVQDSKSRSVQVISSSIDDDWSNLNLFPDCLIDEEPAEILSRGLTSTLEPDQELPKKEQSSVFNSSGVASMQREHADASPSARGLSCPEQNAASQTLVSVGECKSNNANSIADASQDSETLLTGMLGEPLSPFDLSEEDFNEEDLTTSKALNVDPCANLSPITDPPLSFSFASVLTSGTQQGFADLQRQMPESQAKVPLGLFSLKNDPNLLEMGKNHPGVSASAVISTAGLNYLSECPEPGILFDCSRQASSQQKVLVTSRGTVDGSLFCERHGELVLNLEALQTNGEWMEPIETKDKFFQEQRPFHSNSWAKWSNEDANFLRGPHRSFSSGSLRDQAPNLNQDPLISLEDETMSFSNELSSSLPRSSTIDLDDDPLSWSFHSTVVPRNDKNSELPDKIDSTSWLKPVPECSVEAHSDSAVGRLNSLVLTSAQRFRAEYYLPLSGENLENESAAGCAENFNVLKTRYKGARDLNRKVSRPITSPRARVSKSSQPETDSAGGIRNYTVRSREGSPLSKSRSFESFRSSTPEKKPNGGIPQKQVGSTKRSKILERRNISRVSGTLYASVASNGHNHDASSQMFDEVSNCLTQEDNLNAIVAPEHHENDQIESFIGKFEEEGQLETLNTSICFMSGLGGASKSLPSAKDLKDSEEFSTRNHIENLVGMLEFDGKEGIDCQLDGISMSNIEANVEAESSTILCRFPQARPSSLTGSEKPALTAIIDCRFPSENSSGMVCDLDLEKRFGKSAFKNEVSEEGAIRKRMGPRKISEERLESSCKPVPDYGDVSRACFDSANARHTFSEEKSISEAEYLSPAAEKSSRVVDVDAFCSHSDTADPYHTASDTSSASFQVALQEFEREIEKMTENKLKQEAGISFFESEGDLSSVSNQDLTRNFVPDTSNPANLFLASYSETTTTTSEEQKEQMKRCKVLSDNGRQYDIKSTGGDGIQREGSISDHLTVMNDYQPGSPVSSKELESPGDKLMSKTSSERNVSHSMDFLHEVPPRHRLSTKIVRSLSFGEEKKVINTACSEASKVYPKKIHFSRSPSPSREWSSQAGHPLGVARDVSAHENRARSRQKEGKIKMFQTRCNKKQWPAVQEHHHLVKDGRAGEAGLESVSLDLLPTNKIVKDLETPSRLNDLTLLSSDTDPLTAGTRETCKTGSVSKAELVWDDPSEGQKIHHDTFVPSFLEDSIEREFSSPTDKTSYQPSSCKPRQSTGPYSRDHLEDELQKKEPAGPNVSSEHFSTLKTGQFDSVSVLKGNISTQPELLHLDSMVITSDNTPGFGDLPKCSGYFKEAETKLQQSEEQEQSWINIQPQKLNKERHEDIWHVLDQREFQKTSEVNWAENIAAASLSIYKNPLWSEELISEFDIHRRSQDKEMLDTASTREGYKALPYLGNFESIFCPESLEDVCNDDKLTEIFTPPNSETQAAKVFSLNNCLISDLNHSETGSKIPQLKGSNSDNLISESSSSLKNCINRLEKLRRKTDGVISGSNPIPNHSCNEREVRRSFTNKPEEEFNRSNGQTPERRKAEKTCQAENRSAEFTCQLSPVMKGGVQDQSTNFEEEDSVHKTNPTKQLKQLDTMSSTQTIVIDSERFFQTIMQEPDAWTQATQEVANHSSSNPLEASISETLDYVEEQAIGSHKSSSAGHKNKGESSMGFRAEKQPDKKKLNNNDHKIATIDGDLNASEMETITCLSSSFQKKNSEFSWKKAVNMDTNGYISFSKNHATTGCDSLSLTKDKSLHSDTVILKNSSPRQKHSQDAAHSNVFLSRTELMPLQVDKKSVEVNAIGADLLQPQAPLNQGAAGTSLSESSNVDEAAERQSSIDKGSVQELLAGSRNISEKFSMELEPMPGCLCLETTRTCKEIANSEPFQPVAYGISSHSNVPDRKLDKSRSGKDCSGYEELSIYVNQQETSFSATPLSGGSLVLSLDVPDLSGEVEDVKQVTYTPCNSMLVGQEEQAVAISSPHVERDLMSTWFRSIFWHTRKGRDNTDRKGCHAKQSHIPNEREEDLPELSRIEKNVEVLEAEVLKFKQQNRKLQNIVKENEETAAWLAKEKEAWKCQRVHDLQISNSFEEQAKQMKRDQRLENQPRVLLQCSSKRDTLELEEFKAKLSQITADHFKKDPGRQLSIDRLEQVIAVLMEQIQNLQKVKENKGKSLQGQNSENACRNTYPKHDKGVLTPKGKKGKLSRESFSDRAPVSSCKGLTRSHEANGIQKSSKTEKVSTMLSRGSRQISTGSKVKDSRLERSFKPTSKRFSF